MAVKSEELTEMSEKTPFVLEALPSPQVDRFQTGKATLQINTMLLTMQQSAGVGYAKMPHEYTEYDNTTYTDSSATAHVEYDTDSVKYFDWLTRVATTAITLLRQYQKGGRPTVDRTADHQAVLFWYYDDFVAGLQGKKMPKLKETGAAASTVTEILSGISWKDTDITTHDYHWTKLRQLFWAAGKKYRNAFPKQSSRIEHTSTSQEVYDQQVYIFLAMVMIRIWYNFILAQGQSAIAIDLMGIMQGGIINTKYGKDINTKPSFDAIWSDFVERNKVDKLNGLTGLSAYSTYTTNPLVETLITGSTINNVIYELAETSFVPVDSLEWARKYWGIGVYDKNRHFANLLIGGIPDAGNSVTHGTATFALGLETAIHLQIMRVLKGYNLPALVTDAIKNQTHYHFNAITAFDNFFISYQYGKSTQGFCDAVAYVPGRMFWKFTSITAGLLSTQVVNDPQNLHSTNTLKTGRANYQNGLAALLTLGDSIPDYYLCHFPNGITIDELQAALIFEQLLSLTSSTNWNTYRYTLSTIFLFEVYDSLNDGKRMCLAKTSAAVARVELILNPTNQSSSLFTALKWSFGLEAGYIAYERIISEPRPYGEASPVIIKQMGNYFVQDQIAQLLYPMKDVAAPKADKPKKETPKAEPKETTTKPVIETEQELTESTN